MKQNVKQYVSGVLAAVMIMSTLSSSAIAFADSSAI